MSYIPTNWVTGDIITAEKLNKAEDGIASANSALIVNISWNEATGTFDTKYKDIFAAFTAGIPVIVRSLQETYSDEYFNIAYLKEDLHDPKFSVYLTNSTSYDAATEEDYPSAYFG